ncbi:MAG: Set3 complex subunit with deacetylase activity, meiotic-specific repressor of sporulation proteins [Claussenomyces sp. TS43310]|nr:MAG: Set3 complex subunit with deacetylase activity, meiotic-specific repressor of sporulation proteins [Claussenomyces sp. TS43310]
MDIANDGPAQQDDTKMEHPVEISNPQEEGRRDTPSNIRSSPPPAANAPTIELGAESSAGAKSDSEAETVLLPGVDGYSPSKIRKAIKLEDKTDAGSLDSVEERPEDIVDHQARSEGATSTLGKRKRSKNGIRRNDHQHVGYSSGLSSLPTSPVTLSRTDLPGSDNIGLQRPRSVSPVYSTGCNKDRSEDRSSIHQDDIRERSGENKERRTSFERHSAGISAADERVRELKASPSVLQSENTPKQQQQKRSTSPNLEPNRRSLSNQISVPTVNSLIQRKKRPGPLRNTRDRQSFDNHSDDDSSIGESPHPRRSRTRILATPPTGEFASFSKMPKRRRLLYGSSALAVACEHGDVDRARQELSEAPEDLNSADNAGNTPLQCASINGHADVVRFLIDEGCDIHCVNNKKDSPLLDAVENSHLDVVKILLAAGVNSRARNLEGEEPINKIDEDDEDADAIREALLAARPRAVAPDSATHSLPAPSHAISSRNSTSTNPRTLSHGRSRRTGENQLFLQLNVASLRQAASTGDQETALRIVDAIGVNGLDDPESLVNAARGGHEDVLQLLMALGDANPDPKPLSHKDPEYATPILAAIGGDNIGVVKLLLGKIEDGKFDPTRKYNGRAYFEIARERAGPHWQEEERVLKEEFEKYDPSTHRGEFSSHGTSRSSGKRKPEERSNDAKKHPGVSGASHAVQREHKSVSAAEWAQRRGPGRPRKEGRERSVMSDHDAVSSQKKPAPRRSGSDTIASTSEAEPAKDQRKRQRLFSAKDLKNRMERRASVASTVSVEEFNKSNAPGESLANVPFGHGYDSTMSEKPESHNLSAKHGHSQHSLQMMYGESASKRPRSSPTPPSHDTETTALESGLAKTSKRRRLEVNVKGSNRSGSGFSSSPEPNAIKRKSEENVANSRERVQGALRSITPITDENVIHDTNQDQNVQDVPSSQSDGIEDRSKNNPSDEIDTTSTGQDSLSVFQDATKGDVFIKHEVEEDLERQQQEDARLAQEAEERRARIEIANIERAKALKRQEEEEEETARRDAEEAERREQRRRAEAEAHAKAEEERRRLYDEQQRIQREEQERRRAAHIAQQRAEREKALLDERNARLKRLPPLLRWFDAVENPLTPEFAYRFRSLQGVRFDTIRPEATRSVEGKEQWLLNVQVALLLGEKELAFPRYTHWTHIDVSDLAKRTLWKVLSEDYSLISEHLRLPAGLPREPDGALSSKMRNEAWPLFQAHPMFFVKLSDFMSIVPRYPHLKSIEMLVKYRELPPNESWLEKVTFPAKWKQDEDAGSRFGFCPGTKHYINGQFSHEDKPKLGRTSSRPFPSRRVPRIGGIHEVFPGDPSYERLCKEQGLEHLLVGQAVDNRPAQNGIVNGATPPESNTTNEDDSRRLSATSSVASMAAVNGTTNGTKDANS